MPKIISCFIFSVSCSRSTVPSLLGDTWVLISHRHWENPVARVPLYKGCKGNQMAKVHQSEVLASIWSSICSLRLYCTSGEARRYTLVSLWSSNDLNYSFVAILKPYSNTIPLDPVVVLWISFESPLEKAWLLLLSRRIYGICTLDVSSRIHFLNLHSSSKLHLLISSALHYSCVII